MMKNLQMVNNRAIPSPPMKRIEDQVRDKIKIELKIDNLEATTINAAIEMKIQETCSKLNITNTKDYRYFTPEKDTKDKICQETTQLP